MCSPTFQPRLCTLPFGLLVLEDLSIAVFESRHAANSASKVLVQTLSKLLSDSLEEDALTIEITTQANLALRACMSRRIVAADILTFKRRQPPLASHASPD